MRRGLHDWSTGRGYKHKLLSDVHRTLLSLWRDRRVVEGTIACSSAATAAAASVVQSGERRIMEFLVRRRTGVTRSQIAALMRDLPTGGYSPGTVRVYLWQLRGAGYIKNGRDGRITATAFGRRLRRKVSSHAMRG
jgi:hypothetical protein